MISVKLHLVAASNLLLILFFAACQGPPGPPGPQGPQGQQGLVGISGYEVVLESSGWISIEPGKRRTVTATCPSGKKVQVVGSGRWAAWTLREAAPSMIRNGR